MDDKVINPLKVYNVSEAAKVLNINEQTLLDYVRSGKIDAEKIGEWKILGKSLEKFLTKKTYVIVTKEGPSGTIKARDEEELYQKLGTGAYGVLPVRGRQMIKFTPENIKEIVEVSEDNE